MAGTGTPGKGIKKPDYAGHPGVRSGRELTIAERAADLMKDAMGTWSALGLVMASIGLWIWWARDPGHLNLNLALSLMAAVQGVVLQIAQNRSDSQAQELADWDHEMLRRICDHLGICDYPGCDKESGHSDSNHV